jgi:hypothetical protein
MSNYKTLTSSPTQQIIDLLIAGKSISSIVKTFNLPATDVRARNYIISVAASNNIKRRTHRHAYTLDDVKNAIQEALCITDVLKKLNLAPHGGNAGTIKKLITAHNIDIAHFDVASTKQRNKKQWTQDEVFVEHSKVPRPTLSKYVQKFDVIKKECAECHNVGKWRGKKLKLDVDHINGVCDDNRVENLRYLCPNCHSQTGTFGGKNK